MIPHNHATAVHAIDKSQHLSHSIQIVAEIRQMTLHITRYKVRCVKTIYRSIVYCLSIWTLDFKKIINHFNRKTCNKYQIQILYLQKQYNTLKI